jgi:hypothetical protein
MQTVFDWFALALFAGLAVLYLQRSTAAQSQDRIIDYLPPAVGCALGNYAGNHGYPVVGAVILLAVVANIVLVLKPFPRT